MMVPSAPLGWTQRILPVTLLALPRTLRLTVVLTLEPIWRVAGGGGGVVVVVVVYVRVMVWGEED